MGKRGLAKMRIIRNDKECAKQLKRYFVLLLRADRIQSGVEKIMHKLARGVDVPKRTLLRKYYKLGIIGRQLYLIKNNINYYIICVNMLQFNPKWAELDSLWTEEACAV